MTTRIHITSSGPRTGTTLLAEAMVSCFEIDGHSEIEDPISRSNSSFGKANVILTKEPTFIVGYDFLTRINKNLKFICLIRDPRDMICSFHGGIKDKYYCDPTSWIHFVNEFDNVRDNKSILFINYEQFVSEPDVVQQKIQEFVPDLKLTHRFSEFPIQSVSNYSITALKSLRKISPNSVGIYKQHLPRIKQQLLKYPILSDTLVKMGYEKDKSWEIILKDIKEDSSDSVRSYKSIHRRKRIILAALNFFIEKFGLNPDRVLKIFKKII